MDAIDFTRRVCSGLQTRRVRLLSVTGGGGMALQSDDGYAYSVAPKEMTFELSKADNTARLTTVDGFDCVENAVVRLTGSGTRLASGDHVLISAGKLHHPENVATWTVDASAFQNVQTCELKVVGETVVLSVPDVGMLLIFR